MGQFFSAIRVGLYYGMINLGVFFLFLGFLEGISTDFWGLLFTCSFMFFLGLVGLSSLEPEPDPVDFEEGPKQMSMKRKLSLSGGAFGVIGGLIVTYFNLPKPVASRGGFAVEFNIFALGIGVLFLTIGIVYVIKGIRGQK